MLLGQSVSTGSEAPYPVGANIPVVSGEMLLLFSHSVMLDSAAPWTAAYQAPLSFTISQSLLRFMSIESVMPSNHLILCHSLLFLPSILPSIRVFSDEVGSSQFSPVSHSVVSDSLQPHGPQHARFPSPSPTPGKHQVAKVLELQLQHQSFQ